MCIAAKPFLFLVVSLMFFSSAYGQESDPDFFGSGESPDQHDLPAYRGEIVGNKILLIEDMFVGGFGEADVEIDPGFRHRVEFELEVRLYGVSELLYIEDPWNPDVPIVLYEFQQIGEAVTQKCVLFGFETSRRIPCHVTRRLSEHPEDIYDEYFVVSTLRCDVIEPIPEIILEWNPGPNWEILDQENSLLDGQLGN